MKVVVWFGGYARNWANWFIFQLDVGRLIDSYCRWSWKEYWAIFWLEVEGSSDPYMSRSTWLSFSQTPYRRVDMMSMVFCIDAHVTVPFFWWQIPQAAMHDLGLGLLRYRWWNSATTSVALVRFSRGSEVWPAGVY